VGIGFIWRFHALEPGKIVDASMKLSSDKRTMKQATGFTVIELLIAAGILGILSSIAIPSYNAWLPKTRVNSAARELFAELQLAKMRAISENNDYVITFDTADNTYSIYDDDDNDFATTGTESDELVKAIEIDDRHPGIEYGYIAGNSPSGSAITKTVTFSGTPPRVAFSPTGLANKNGSIYLVPTVDTSNSRKDRQRLITVLKTGRVRLYRHTGSSWE
jgi:prepilin-type N-terminal cleavage/methylation domain-containing protein